MYIPANWGRGRGRQQAFRREFKLRSRWTFRDQRLRQPTSRPAGPINSSVSCQSDSRACVNHALIIPTVIETSLCHCLLRPRLVRSVSTPCAVQTWFIGDIECKIHLSTLTTCCIGKTALCVKKMTATGCTNSRYEYLLLLNVSTRHARFSIFVVVYLFYHHVYYYAV